MQVTVREQICKIGCRVVWRAVWGAGAGAGAVLGFCLGLFEVLVTVQAHFYEIGGSAVRGDGPGILRD